MKPTVTLLTALLLAPLATLNAVAPPAKSNILFILTDNEGLSDVGCYGSDRFKGKTPNIDALGARRRLSLRNSPT